jgi:hypothetical protein
VTRRVILVVEGTSDARRVRGVWRAVGATVPLSGVTASQEFFDVHTTHAYFKRRFGGRTFAGQPIGSGHAGVLRRLLQATKRDPDAVGAIGMVFVVDEDGAASTVADQLRAARDALAAPAGPWSSAGPEPIAVGAPSPCSEAWVIAGYQARSSEDRANLERLKRALTFDPVASPERLNHQRVGAHPDRWAKSVLERLGLDDLEAEAAAITAAATTPTTGTRGAGLDAFVHEPDARIPKV